jgi:NADH-quinone oxidoreductase chain G
MNFNITVNKKTISVNSNMTILQACELGNIIIPKFCYHERLSIAGNCRMCLVEVDKAPKLVASCAMPVMQNMIVYTNSLAVKKAREGVLEFLLINHPLDCAICDQAGECDLQEQSKGFGSDRGRFQENKRAVQDFECGPLIKTVMTRCIHCTRCVRFANEIIGLPDLGTSGRGVNLEINLYVKKLFKSEFSGNLIDLCPVGALTSKPYAFVARSWELKSIESIDILDGLGSNIRLDVRGYEIMRILPRLNENINEEWISDKTRFAFDGLQQQRLYEPVLKNNSGIFETTTWRHAIKLVLAKLTSVSVPYLFGGVIGPQADVESIVLLNFLIKKFNGQFIDFDNFSMSNIDFKSFYLFNSNFKNLENADICLLLGVNPRIEGAILNLRLRKRYLAGNFKIASFGSYFDMSIPTYNLGSTFSALLKFVEGKHVFSKYFAKAKKPIIIIGQSLLEVLGEKELYSILKTLIKNTACLNKGWCGINILNNKASDSGKYEIGVKTSLNTRVPFKVLYSIGNGKVHRFSPSTFIVYQGYQANNTTQNVDLILPGKAFTEKISTFVNSEGRYQLTKSAISSPTTSKDDWSILYAILDKLNCVSYIQTRLASNYLRYVTESLKRENNNNGLKLFNISSDVYKLYQQTLFLFFLFDKKYTKATSPIKKLIFSQNSHTQILLNTLFSFVLKDTKNTATFITELRNILDIVEFNVNEQTINAIELNKTDSINIHFEYVNQNPAHLIHTIIDQSFLAYLPYVYMTKNIYNILASLETSFFESFSAFFETAILIEKSKNFDFSKYFLFQDYFKNYETCSEEVTLDTEDPHLEIYTNYLQRKNLKLFDFLGSLLFKVIQQDTITVDISCNSEEIFYNIFKDVHNIYRVGFAFSNPAFYGRDDFFFYVPQTIIGVIFHETKDCVNISFKINKFFSNNILENKFFNKYLFTFFVYSNTSNNFIDKNNFLSSLEKIKTLYALNSNFNVITFQHPSLRNYSFKQMKRIPFAIQNKFLLSSQFDNFYLADDFSKLSILMKRCSDTILERSIFKKF